MSMLERISASQSERRHNRERRKLQRSSARGAGVSVSHDGSLDVALCGDVSAAGVRLSLGEPIAVGTVVHVNFGPDLVLSGRVVWVENADCGIEFDETVDGTVRNLPAVPERRGERGLANLNAAPRFREGLSVTVVLPDCERKAVLRWSEEKLASFTLQG